jgi:hypothetical protein
MLPPARPSTASQEVHAPGTPPVGAGDGTAAAGGEEGQNGGSFSGLSESEQKTSESWNEDPDHEEVFDHNAVPDHPLTAQDPRQQSQAARRAERLRAERRAADVRAAVQGATLDEVQSGAFTERTGIRLTGREVLQHFPAAADGK